MKAKIIFGILLLAVCSARMSLAAQTADPANYFYVKPSGGTQWAGKDAARVFDDAQQTAVIDAISAAAAWAGANHTTTNTVFSGGGTQGVFVNSSLDATATLENAVITEGHAHYK